VADVPRSSSVEASGTTPPGGGGLVAVDVGVGDAVDVGVADAVDVGVGDAVDVGVDVGVGVISSITMPPAMAIVIPLAGFQSGWVASTADSGWIQTHESPPGTVSTLL
jgi:hypothetical protein